jgi:hypothetical protein
MEHQGGRRSRPAADPRQAPWADAEDPDGPGELIGPGQLLGPGTGGYRVLGAGSGGGAAQPFEGGTGSHRALGYGTGAQPTLDRTPVRGFPPAAPQGYQGQATPPQGFQQAQGFSPAQTAPQGFQSAQTAPQGFQSAQTLPQGYQQAQTPPRGFGVAGDEHDDDPVAPASMGPGAGPGRRAARSAGSSRRSSSSRTAWLAVVVALVVAAGAFAGYKFLYEPRVNAPVPASLRLPTNAPGSPGFDQALGKWQHIGTRSQDPEPLTLAQLFPPQFELNGSSYERTAAAVTKDCTQAVYGSNLQTALQSGHCTQVLRASYISGNGTMMGTVGVANLTSSNAAQKAGNTTGTQQIIAPLAGQKGPTAKLGNGTGVVQAEIKGHYLILMWAEFTNLKSPSTSAQRQQLEQFAANLVIGSANINLSTRMLTGKPGSS